VERIVGAAAAARGAVLPNGGDLTPGQVVRARVVHVDGDRVQLAVGGQRIPAVARVPLKVGQEVSLSIRYGPL
jgi:hypothetical protein